jgi:hypothetical protein
MIKTRLLLTVTAVTLAACASYSAKPLAVRAPDAYKAHVAAQDIVAGGEGYFTEEKSRAVLDQDVTTYFMPVLVSVRNDASEFVTIDRSEMVLVSSDGKVSHPVSWQTMYRGYKNDVATDTAVLGVISGSASEDANDQMAEDWRHKEFREQSSLAQGRRVGGLVYFRRNHGTGPFTLKIVADKMKSQKEVTLQIPIE